MFQCGFPHHGSVRVTLHPCMQAISGIILKCTIEKTNGTSVIIHFLKHKCWGHIWKCIVENHNCIIAADKLFKGTFENAQWGKAKHMELLWLCIPADRHFKTHTIWGFIWKCTVEKSYFQDPIMKILWKTFCVKLSLDIHILRHTGERTLACDICDICAPPPSWYWHHQSNSRYFCEMCTS